MKYCLSCDIDYSATYIRKHYRSDKHLMKTFEIKRIEGHKNILVKDIDSVFSDLFEKHKRKFKYFFIICKIINKKLQGLYQTRFIKILR